MALTYPNIDPVAFAIGPLEIRWYGLAYLAGFLLGWFIVKRVNRLSATPLKDQLIDDIIIWITFGVILGGRLGYVLLYHPYLFFEDILAVFAIWEGGMSFHGGLIGVVLATLLYCHKYKIKFFVMGDLLAIGTPLGILFGRLANFINGELYGRITDVSWAMVFPRGGPYPRHPSQLYEGFLEGLVLFILLLSIKLIYRDKLKTGTISGLFLIFYAIFRFTAEFFREPADGFMGLFTTGQAYCIPMFLVGAMILHVTYKKVDHEKPS